MENRLGRARSIEVYNIWKKTLAVQTGQDLRRRRAASPRVVASMFLEKTLVTTINYASSLNQIRRYKEAKSLLCKAVPVARRILGDSIDVTLKLRWLYGRVLYRDDGATLDDLREAVTTLEDVERIARRVFGGAHPLTTETERDLQFARGTLAAHESQSPGSSY